MGSSSRRFVRALALLLVIPAVIGGVGAGALLVAGLDVTSGSSHGHFGFERRHLTPVPIPVSACPFVGAVRAAATTAAADTQLIIEGLGPSDGPKIPLPERYGDHLAALDLAARVTATKVPPAVRIRLERVAEQVEQGRAALRGAPDALTYLERTMNPLADGVRALQDASDLVGDACGQSLTSDYLL